MRTRWGGCYNLRVTIFLSLFAGYSVIVLVQVPHDRMSSHAGMNLEFMFTTASRGQYFWWVPVYCCNVTCPACFSVHNLPFLSLANIQCLLACWPPCTHGVVWLWLTRCLYVSFQKPLVSTCHLFPLAPKLSLSSLFLQH